LIRALTKLSLSTIQRKEYEIAANSYDPLSGFYSVRKKILKVGQVVSVKVFDSAKMWDVPVEVLRKEQIEVPAGIFDTIVIKPHLKSEGVFKRSGEVIIWLTDDERKVPVMVKSKVLIGSIDAQLTGGSY
jgi:hypothetical protein